MKRIAFTFVIAFSALLLFSQAPQAFKYQSVVRDNTGEILANHDVSFRIGIHSNATGVPVYIETHGSTTNEQGLVSLEIGNGEYVSGDFTSINWGADSYFLQVEMDAAGGTNYLLMGTSQILSVPYALLAENVSHDRDEQLFSVRGDTLFISNGNYVILPGVVPIISFNCGDKATDIDGNNYNTVLIGSQCWMAENLKTTRYKNGTQIPNVADGAQWASLTTGAYVWYDNDMAWKDSYGALYNWYAVVDLNGLCPAGWRIPAHDELTALTDFIGGTSSPHGNALKSCRQVNSPLGGDCNTSGHPRWDEDTQNGNYGTDDYGISALPAGFRFPIGQFYFMGNRGTWLSSSEYSSVYAWGLYLYYDDGDVLVGYSDKRFGFSVRCIKD